MAASPKSFRFFLKKKTDSKYFSALKNKKISAGVIYGMERNRQQTLRANHRVSSDLPSRACRNIPDGFVIKNTNLDVVLLASTRHNDVLLKGKKKIWSPAQS